MAIEREPWIPYSAREFLGGILAEMDSATIFEWGAGGSTLYFADKGARVLTVEDNAEWYRAVVAELSASPDAFARVNIALIEAGYGQRFGCDISDPVCYVERGVPDRNWRDYASAVDKCADESLDIVLVDGYSRPACIAHALTKLKHGGWLVLDNSDRDYYLANVGKLLQSWPMCKFCGPGPYNSYEWCCSFWRKP